MQETFLLLVELCCCVVLVSSGCGWFILLVCESVARQHYSQRKRYVRQKVMVRQSDVPASAHWYTLLQQQRGHVRGCGW